jgi:hypothetical protein
LRRQFDSDPRHQPSHKASAGKPYSLILTIAFPGKTIKDTHRTYSRETFVSSHGNPYERTLSMKKFFLLAFSLCLSLAVLYALNNLINGHQSGPDKPLPEAISIVRPPGTEVS